MKIFKLTYNELIKQFKKPSVTIMFLLILLSAIALPIGISKTPQDRYLESYMYSAESSLQEAQGEVGEYKNTKTPEGKIQYRYAQIREQENKLLLDYKVGYGDWRERDIAILADKFYELAPVDFILEGIDIDTISKNLINVDPDKIQSYYSLSKPKLQEIKAKLESDIKNHIEILENDDYLSYIKEEIKINEENIIQYKKYIQEYKELKSKDSISKEELEEEIKNTEHSIKNSETTIAILQMRYDNKIDYSKNNWKNKSIKVIEEETQELSIKMASEEDYYMRPQDQMNSGRYEDYVKNYERIGKQRVDNINKRWYGLENDIPSLGDIDDARCVLDSTYEIYIILAVVMVIIVAGGIVSSEYSRGSIRLLLIRPVSRWKILLSKLIATLVIGFLVVILGIGILYISTGVVYGFETYQTPILQIINDTVVEQSFMSMILPKIINSCSSLLFMSSFVFAMSTISKNTVLSVAISMLLYSGAAFFTSIIASIKISWIMYTLMPYINVSYFKLVPTTQEALETWCGIQMQYMLGATQLLIASIIMIAIAFITFIKKDVEN